MVPIFFPRDFPRLFGQMHGYFVKSSQDIFLPYSYCETFFFWLFIGVVEVPASLVKLHN